MNCQEVTMQKEPKEALEQLKKDYTEPQMSQDQLTVLLLRMAEAKVDNRSDRRRAVYKRWVATAAAVVMVFLILPNTSPKVASAMGQIPVLGSLVKVVTIRNYQYESDRNKADIKVPEILAEDLTGDSSGNDVLEKTAEEINAEIARITDEIVTQFKEQLNEDLGYQDVLVKGEVLATQEDYFTLKLFCYRSSGTGYQWNYYYTIDLRSGERLKLADIFADGADYITPISANIKEQMMAQMEADENVLYWLDSEIEEWNFKSITENTAFYLNEAGNVVIGFNEGDVAPMYMGAVEFEIPGDILADIRK